MLVMVNIAKISLVFEEVLSIISEVKNLSSLKTILLYLHIEYTKYNRNDLALL